MTMPDTSGSLLQAARALIAAFPGAAGEDDARARRDAFITSYRCWLVNHASVPGSPDERMEKIRLLLTAATAATDLQQAIDIILRFGRLVMPELSPARMEQRGDRVALVFQRDRLAGIDGLINELWPLTLLLSQLECLTGRPVDGAEGMIRHDSGVPDDTPALLFDQPLRFNQAELALVLPRRHLARAVVARPEQVSAFLPRLAPGALDDDPLQRPAFTALLRGILRLDRLAGLQLSTLDAIAQRLNCSPATLRRRLVEEGGSYRTLRDAVNDDLARRWLGEGRMTVEQVGERLGFSDAYSFARFFVRINGCTPARYRRNALAVSENVVFADNDDIALTDAATDKLAQEHAVQNGQDHG